MSADKSTATKAVEKLQRFLLPRAGEPYDVRMLYLIEAEHNTARATWEDRGSVSLAAGNELSFLTYFNAFPASYWRRWSQLDSVILKVEVAGTARVDVYRSKIDGARIAVEGQVVTDGTAEFELSLQPFEDGGWLWFDLTAETDTTVIEAGWYASQAPGPQTLPDGTQVGPFEPRVTVGIPTFNRPADAVAALEALASDPEVDAVIDTMIMPDQGTKHPADEPGYKAATEHFGERFFEFRQGNLGGSGGYSRIMYEALGGVDGTGAAGAKKSPYILYMDDDIAIEPDSVLRALQVARYAKSPMLVGGQMLNLQERSHLHTMGEVIGRHDFMWTSAPHVHYDHDFAKHPLADRGKPGDKPGMPNSVDLHRRIDAEFNGWWMCMIPRVVAEEIGQPLPLFIKWDDAEFGLRAGRHGYPTATWPGIAIWHMAWSDKDDAIDWQAYFHLRNRLVVAANYHDGPVDGIIKSMQKATIKHLMCLEYSTVAIQNEAMKDFLAGPDQLFNILESSLPRIATIRKGYSDAVVLPTAADLPKPTGIPGVPTRDIGGRLAPIKKAVWLAKGLKHSLSKENKDHHEVPQANLSPIEARWFSLSRLDGATVTTADGRGVVYRKRNVEQAKELLKESRRLQKEVAENFDRLRGEYRAAHKHLTSREAWSEIFAGGVDE
ncbi:glycosyltransferase [Corynebacterium pseudotuberculosis]|uniref:Glycosyltransferase n=1 Tax=Corynebacterium pseudotuberculosis (strain C231) TaxID=681645 RepID=D9QCY0_CORP2|nr:glycosyltransferase [Corynebacterium pseudotuberculosis]ADK29757.1 glycosyltransferase [Corynebacterium pseudotuberculosis FRC41]ADL11406.1 glycosyltransferase [Corynebacterium pseudotuberculosis C231]ADL21818.1 glycosyltransferase family 2 protein [Corynebacterium pseudotuberculosis 1002]ADO27216.1 glycosyltransferase [Corynebacterium pseudotuberculosis I19]AEK93275.1 Glycosyltransferase [Corynebacterium pseudotuberculosis PAT10]